MSLSCIPKLTHRPLGPITWFFLILWERQGEERNKSNKIKVWNYRLLRRCRAIRRNNSSRTTGTTLPITSSTIRTTASIIMATSYAIDLWIFYLVWNQATRSSYSTILPANIARYSTLDGTIPSQVRILEHLQRLSKLRIRATVLSLFWDTINHSWSRVTPIDYISRNRMEDVS